MPDILEILDDSIPPAINTASVLGLSATRLQEILTSAYVPASNTRLIEEVRSDGTRSTKLRVCDTVVHGLVEEGLSNKQVVWKVAKVLFTDEELSNSTYLGKAFCNLRQYGLESFLMVTANF